MADVARDMDGIALALAARLRKDLPEYEVVPVEDNRRMIAQEYRNIFAGLVEARPPNPAETAHSRLLGRRRAEQGIAVESVLAAYHIGLRLAWDELQARTLRQAPELLPDLLPVVGSLWDALRSFTTAAVEGYEGAAATRRTSRVALMQSLITGLFSGRPDDETVVAAARALGFDPDREFQVVCAPGGDWPPDRMNDLQDRLLRQHTTLAAPLGTTLFVIAQNVPEAEVARLLESSVAGFGLVRRGLSGAAESLIDAERALALAERRKTTVRFEDSWLYATVLPQLPRLRALLDAGPAATQPHLAEAVQAYAGHGFSITASSRALHIHPNTLKYRLDRWQELTGWDPRTLDGLLRSLLSLPAG